MAASISNAKAKENVLGDTMRHLAQAYASKYAFYAVYADDSRETMRVRALWDGEKLITEGIYRLRGTPCEDVLSGRVCIIERDVQQRYPEDDVLENWHVESYFGVALKDSSDNAIGTIAVMDVKPMRLPDWSQAILHVFADRISGELEHRNAEENIYQLAHYDVLTGLPNRLLFHDRLEQAVAHAKRNDQYVALLFLDLDRRCQPWRAKRRLVVPSSREAALLTRRAHSARG